MAYLLRRKKTEPAPLPAGYVIESTSPSVDQLKDTYSKIGLSDVDRFVTGTGNNRRFNETKAQEATIREVYKLDPKAYVANNRLDFNAATKKYNFELPKLENPETKNFVSAVNAFQSAVNKIGEIGVDKLNATDKKTFSALAKKVRDYDSKSLSAESRQTISNVTDSERALNSIYDQIESVRVQKLRTNNLDADGTTRLNLSGKELEAARGRYETEQDTLRRLISQTTQTIPLLSESLGRIDLEDVVKNVGAEDTRLGQVSAGLEELRGDRLFNTGTFGGMLNSQITDDQIISDINTARRNEYKKLADLGDAAVTDLQSQLTQANEFMSALPASDARRAATQKTIDNLNKEIASAQKDALEARNLFNNYQPISGTQATNFVSQFRENLRLPEERTLQQIREIDPNLFNTIQGLSKQYSELATTPLGATTAESTEALRRQTEESIAAQLRLGSQLGAEEQRQYQQAARAAQTARGNIFGVAPAVEEAVTTGLAGEQRLAARLGAAQGFLSSGQSVSDAMARDVSLRNALQQSRLGAAAEFAAAGPSAYNMASQRAAQQQALLQQYVGAATQQAAGQTGGFQAQQGQMIPYAYVNPQAGFLGAQNAAQIYNTLADLQASQYGSQVGAIASSYQSPFQAFGQVAGGIGSLLSPLKFG